MDKPRDSHLDEFQEKADNFLARWKIILDQRPRYSSGRISEDTLVSLGSLINDLAVVQARTNTMLSEAIDKLEDSS